MISQSKAMIRQNREMVILYNLPVDIRHLKLKVGRGDDDIGISRV
jgi:hypothetical protein